MASAWSGVLLGRFISFELCGLGDFLFDNRLDRYFTGDLGNLDGDLSLDDALDSLDPGFIGHGVGDFGNLDGFNRFGNSRLGNRLGNLGFDLCFFSNGERFGDLGVGSGHNGLGGFGGQTVGCIHLTGGGGNGNLSSRISDVLGCHGGLDRLDGLGDLYSGSLCSHIGNLIGDGGSHDLGDGLLLSTLRLGASCLELGPGLAGAGTLAASSFDQATTALTLLATTGLDQSACHHRPR